MNENMDDLRDALDDIYSICYAHGLNIEVHENGEHVEIWHNTLDMIDIVFPNPEESV